jgi:hypothetical protein
VSEKFSPSALPVFSCGQRFFFLGDVLAGAERLGLMDAHLSGWRDRNEALVAAEAQGLEVDPSEVEAFLEEFRYARDLVSGEECEAWLAKLGLEFADLQGYAERCLLAQAAEVEIEADVEETETAVEDAEGDADGDPENQRLAETTQPLAADLVLDPAFGSWARSLARRLAVAHETGCIPADTAEPDWEAIEALYADEQRRCVDEHARLTLLQANWMDLIKVAIETLELDTPEAAREALLCVREEGATLASISEENRLPLKEACGFLSDYGMDLRQPLAAAKAGDLLHVVAESGMHLALRVLSREEPSLSNSEVAKRLDDALVEARLAALEAKHIRWSVRLDTEE